MFQLLEPWKPRFAECNRKRSQGRNDLQKDKAKGTKLIKEGWVDAKLSKNDLRYYRNKFKKYLTNEDQIKRASYLALNN